MSGKTESSDRRSQRRTNVVFLLGRMDIPVTIDELVDELQRHAERQPDSTAMGESWEDLHERLHRDDLPALDRAGLLTFDDERGIITHASTPEHGPFAPNPRTETEAETGMEAEARGNDAAWYQLGLALLATLVLVATALGAGPFANLSSGSVATALVAVLVVASVVTALQYGT